MSEKRTIEEKNKRMPATEKTYGEKVHNFVFNKLINFWTTLAVSGLFVYWFKHSTTKIPFLGGKVASEFHDGFRKTFQKMGVVKTLGRTEKGAEEVGNVMADALSINLPGTLTILPSAWLGAKYKTQIVEAIDRRHYGVNAEDNPAIAERHQIIRDEKKPTFLGAATARIGTMGASVGASFLIGADKNLLKRAGVKNFNGIDQFAGRLGEGAGRVIAESTPAVTRSVDTIARKMGTDWTRGPQNTPGFNNALEGIMKYTSLDVMYTIITSSTITPFVKAIKNLPFMSYQETPKASVAKPVAVAKPVPEEVKAEKTVPHDAADRPRAHVSHISKGETLNPEHHTELHHQDIW